MRIPANLHPEVQAVVDQPYDRDLLVSGPPGSGKSTVALFRAETIARMNALKNEDRPVYLLSYNKTLKADVEDGIRRVAGSPRARLPQGIVPRPVEPRTFLSFLNSLQNAARGRFLAQYSVDWPKARQALLSPEGLDRLRSSAETSRPCLVIDEGQDMPPQFYLLLQRLRDRLGWSLSVFADDNQCDRDAANSSSLSEIEECLEVYGGNPGRHALTFNHRNAFRVALFARRFYVRGLAGGWTRLPENAASNPVEIVSAHNRGTAVERIVNEARNRAGASVGVLCPTDAVRRAYVSALRAHLDARGEPVKLHTYSSRERGLPMPSFGEPGIFVLNFHSSKGLEFDSVHLVGLESHRMSETAPDRDKMRFYILSTRARDQLRLSYGSRERPAVFDMILPPPMAPLMVYRDVPPTTLEGCVKEVVWE